MRRLLLMLLMPSVALAQGAYYQNNAFTATYINGTHVVSVIDNSTVQICTTVDGACTLVPIFSDQALTLPVLNPIAIDGYGNFGFFVTPGTYSYRILDSVGAQLIAYPFTTGGAGGGGGGGCGSVAGDNTSTNCGFGNRVGDTGANPENATSYGTGNLATNATREVVAIGDTNVTGGTSPKFDVIGIGDNNAQNIGASSDIVAMGDVSYLNITNGSDTVAIGDSALANNSGNSMSTQRVIAIGNQAFLQQSGTPSPTLVNSIALGYNAGENSSGVNIIGIGQAAASSVPSGNDIIGIGRNTASSEGSNTSSVVGIGVGAADGGGNSSANIVGIGESVAENTGASSADVIAIGQNVNGASHATLTNAIGIGTNITLASNTTIIGDPSTTSLKLFGSGDGCLSSTSGAIIGSGSPCQQIKARVSFNGSGGVVISDSLNIASVVRYAAGKYTITFTTPMATANYTVAVSGTTVSGGTLIGGFIYDAAAGGIDPTTTTLTVAGIYQSGSSLFTGDLQRCDVVVYGN